MRRLQKIEIGALLLARLVFCPSPAGADTENKIDQAVSVILDLCLAKGSERVEITNQGNDVIVGSGHVSIQVRTTEYAGIVGGISKQINTIMAEQATETRACTQRYIDQITNFIFDRKGEKEFPNVGKQNLSSNDELISIRSLVNSTIGHQVSDRIVNRLRELDCAAAVDQNDARLNIEVENIEIKGPYPDVSDRVSWSTSVMINIAVRDAQNNKLFLLTPFHTKVATDDPKTSEYSAILEAANLIAEYIHTKRPELSSVH